MFTSRRSVLSIAAMSASLLVPSAALANTDFGAATTTGGVAKTGLVGSGTIAKDAATVTGNIAPAVTGTKHVGDTKAQEALAKSARIAESVPAYTSDQTGTKLAGSYTIQDGDRASVFHWSETMTSEGSVVIDGANKEGETSPKFTFVVDGSAIFKSSTKFEFKNGASACNTIFVLRSGVKIEDNTVLGGSFIAESHSITQIGGSVTGRLISLLNSVTVGGNVDVSSCIPATPEQPTPPTTPPTTPTPTPPAPPTPSTPQVPQGPQPTPVTPAATPAPPAATAKPRRPIKNANVRKPSCTKNNSMTSVSGTSIKSVKLGARTIKATKNGTLVKVSVDTRLFKSAKKTLKLQVVFTDGSTKTVKVVAKKCGGSKTAVKKPKFTG